MISRDQRDLQQWWDSARQDYLAVRKGPHRRSRSTIGQRGTDADYHIASEADFLEMIEISRDVQRNDPVVSQGVRRLAHNVVQDGITPKANTGDKAVDDQLDSLYAEWVKAENCDARATSSFTDLQELALIQTIFDGDIMALPLSEEGSLLMREAHRMRTPNDQRTDTIHGVKLDGRRRPIGYYFTKDEVSRFSYQASGTFDFYEAETMDDFGRCKNVLHVFSPQRVSQTRGLSSLAPIMDTLTYHDDLHFATLVKAQMSACVIMKRELTADADPFTDDSDASETRQFTDGFNRKFEQMYPGMVIPGIPGETIGMDSANVPSPEYFQHSMMLCSIIAVNLGIPLGVFFLDAKQTNFSGWRGSIDQARIGWQDLQYLLRDKFVRPTWEWKVRQFISQDSALLRASKSLDMLNAKYRLPGWKYIQPEIDSQSDRFQIATLQTSPTRKCAERGLGEYRDIADEVISDNEYAIVKAMEAHERIVKQFPQNKERLFWEQCLVLPVPDGLRLNMSLSEQTKAEDVNSANQ